jgi:hypothetical protein
MILQTKQQYSMSDFGIMELNYIFMALMFIERHFLVFFLLDYTVLLIHVYYFIIFRHAPNQNGLGLVHT